MIISGANRVDYSTALEMKTKMFGGLHKLTWYIKANDSNTIPLDITLILLWFPYEYKKKTSIIVFVAVASAATKKNANK